MIKKEKDPLSTIGNTNIVRASAGTGKTFTLTNIYIHLILNGISPDKILASTFTVKAATEIRDRVLERLGNASLSNEAAKKLSSELKIPDLNRDLASQTFFKLVRSQHRLAIQTLDSFAISIARTFGGELGLAPQWSIVTPELLTRWREDTIQNVIENLSLDELRELLAMLSRAGAYKISEFLLGLLEEVESLFKIPGLSDSLDKAWIWSDSILPEIKIDLDKLVNEISNLKLPCNKNGTVNKYWKDAVEFDLKSIRDGDLSKIAEKGIISAILKREPNYSRHPIEQDVLSAYEPLKLLLIQREKKRIADKNRATRELYSAIRREINKGSEPRQQLSFDDIKLLIANISTDISLSELYFRLDSTYRHLLLDEFQDTSLSEWRILEPIIQEIFSQNSEPRSFLCVGDGKQAIYGWRGGKAEIFDEIDRLNYMGDISVSSLNTSYRSSQAVIDLVNRIFSSLAKDDQIQQYPGVANYWNSNFLHHSTAREDIKGEVYLRDIQKDEESNDNPDQIKFIEAAKAAAAIERSSTNGTIAILVRKNDSVSKVMEILSAPPFNILASQEGGSTLNKTYQLTPFISLCRFIDHPGDTLAFYHIAISPLASVIGASHSMDIPARANLARKLREDLFNNGYGITLSKILEAVSEQFDKRTLRRAKQLVELGFEFDLRRGVRVSEFIELLEDTKLEDPNMSRIRVMTVHQSKGLEFEYVILPEIDYQLDQNRPGLLISRKDPLGPPTTISWTPQACFKEFFPEIEEAASLVRSSKLTEELNLFYVAITRAKRSILLISSSSENERRTINAAALTRAAIDPNCILQQEVDYQNLFTVSSEAKNNTLHNKESSNDLIVGITRKKRLGAPIVELKKPSEGKTEALRLSIISEGEMKAKKRGVALHLLFQSIEWLDDEVVKKLSQVALDEVGISHEEELVLRKEFDQIIKIPQIMDLFKEELYKKSSVNIKVERELPVTQLIDDQLISGIVDRLVITLDQDGKPIKAHLIDFKSDKCTPQGIHDLVDKYRGQLSRYVAAVSAIYGIAISDIKASIAFVTPGLIYEVT